MRELLLISYHFPPMGGSGVQRAAKLAKYLPSAGWRAQVLCAGHRHYPLRDESLLDGVDSQSVHGVVGLEPGGVAARLCGMIGDSQFTRHCQDRICWRLEGLMNLLPLPERELAWVPSAVAWARRLVRSRPIEAVVSTSPPLAAHLVGRSLKRRLGLPWIADLRDPIVDNFGAEDRSLLSHSYAGWLESLVAREADRIIVTCPDLADRLTCRYGSALEGRICTIPNGYDPADRPAAVMKADDRFTLTHVGSFYGQQSIEPILIALRELLAARPDLRGRIVFRVVGSLSGAQRAVLREQDTEYIELRGYQTHAEAIREMALADALILIVPSVDGGKYCIPAKTFEYLAFGGHILAWAHQNTALHCELRNAGACTMVADSSPTGWRNAIEASLDKWRAGLLNRTRRPEVVERFRRDRLAETYAHLIQNCVRPESRLFVEHVLFPSTEAA